MLNETLNISQKRDALERALSHFLPDSLLQRVLNYWEQEYGEKPTFVLNRFVNEICNTADLKEQRKEILRQVLQELAITEKQAFNEAPVQEEQHQIVEEQELFSGNIVDACAYFVQQVLDHVNDRDRTEFEQEVRQELKLQGIACQEYGAMHSQDVVEWLPLTYYSSFITLLYTLCCEFYGPIKTDQLYSRVRLELKQLFPDVDIRVLL